LNISIFLLNFTFFRVSLGTRFTVYNILDCEKKLQKIGGYAQMRTPKEYSAMIKEGVVTTKVLGEVLFSINKRAKNWRDQKRTYKMTYYEKTYERAVEEEKKYYQILLSPFNF